MQTTESTKFNKNTTALPRSSAFFSPVIQRKYSINKPGDTYEREADRVADEIMSKRDANDAPQFFAPVSTSGVVQRKCPSCEEEKMINRKDASEGSANVTPTVHSALSSTGQPLDHHTKDFMESRFGQDFSDVRIHNDSTANHSAADINAMAYTNRNNVVFGAGQFSPDTNHGKQLLAHELTHVLQQRQGSSNSIQRSVASSSSCPKTSDPKRPLPAALTFLILDNMSASSMVSFSMMMLRMDLWKTSGPLSGPGFDAYRNRFGEPISKRGKFTNRFDKSEHPSLKAAQISEMEFLIRRLENVRTALGKDISFHCLSTAGKKVGKCTFRKCKDDHVLKSCRGTSAIAICPPYWDLDPSQRGIGIIHEMFHIIYGFDDFDDEKKVIPLSKRPKEPECYSSMVADINNKTPFDPSCPTI